MRHIKKTPETSEVKEYEDELKKGKFDKEHLSDPLVHPSMKGPDVYDAVKSFTSFERLKDRMFSDQGGFAAIAAVVCNILLIRNILLSMSSRKKKTGLWQVNMKICFFLAGPLLQKKSAGRLLPRKSGIYSFIVTSQKDRV